jgi:hypothetical protein
MSAHHTDGNRQSLPMPGCSELRLCRSRTITAQTVGWSLTWGWIVGASAGTGSRRIVLWSDLVVSATEAAIAL